MSPRLQPLTKLPEGKLACPEIDDPGQGGPRRCATPGPEALDVERTRALVESEQLLRAALQQMDQGLVLLDKSLTVRLCNPRALQLLGLSADVLHENASFQDIRAFQNTRGDFSLVPLSTSRIISGSDARRFPLIYDWPRPDGLTLEVRRVQLPDGGSINTFTDITKRRAAELAIQDSERVHRLLAERVEQLAQTDELTGLLNRRYIMRALNDEVAHAQRIGEPCSIAIIDLDLFKRINDRFGHPAGDEVLRSFAIAASANIRNIDRLGRYGGEEFLLILPCAPMQQATEVLNRLRAIIADLDWTALSERLKVTMSAGLAQLRPDESPDEILARADAALYRAKDAGRNCVTCA